MANRLYHVQRLLVCCTLLLAQALLLSWPATGQSAVYWTSDEGIHRLDLQSRESATILSPTLVNPAMLQVDGDQMFWVDDRSDIRAASIDGHNLRTVSEDRGIICLAIDAKRDEIFWLKYQSNLGYALWRTGYDGSEEAQLLTLPGNGYPNGCFFDAQSATFYWTTRKGWSTGEETVRSVQLDGTGSQVLDRPSVRGASPGPISFNSDTGDVYWVESTGRQDYIVRLSGSGPERLASIPEGMTVDVLLIDVTTGRLYWTELDKPYLPDTVPSSGKIQSADLDGNDVIEIVLSGDHFPSGLGMSGSELIWTDPASGSISRAQVDGSGAETVINSTIGRPNQIVIDADAGMMYWSESNASPRGSKIKRSNLDGSGIEDLLVSGPNTAPSGLVIFDGLLYWSTWEWAWVTFGGVYRANLDGSSVETLADEAAWDLSIDPAAGALYWSVSGDDAGTNTDVIRRASLDGADPQVVVTSERFEFASMRIDVPETGSICWISADNILMQRAIDGTTDTEVFRLNDEYNLTDFSVESAYIYMLMSDGLVRTNSDGSDPVELLTTGEHVINGFAVGGSEASVATESREMPDGFALRPAYPNPFNPVTIITYELAEGADVSLAAFDVLGRSVRALDNGFRPAGSYSVRFNADGLPTGTYLIRLTSAGQTRTQLAVLLR